MADPIRLGLFEVDNDAVNCFRQEKCRRPGADTEVVRLVLKMIRQNYTIIDLEQEYGVTYDFGNLLGNGSWTGVAKLLIDDKIDMCGLSMRITPDRKKSLLFSYPTRYFQTSLRFPVIPDLRCLFFICATSLFSAFLLAQYYQTQMYAFLASPAYFKVPFYTFSQALDYVERGKGFFSTFDTQTVICPTETLRQRFEKISETTPVRRHTTQKGIEMDLDNGGIYQSQLDTAFLQSTVSWLDTEYSRIVIQDTEAAMQLVAFAFSSRQRRLRDRFNDGLIKMLPAVPHINRHGYHTLKEPFQMQYQPQLAPLSMTKQLGQPFRLYFIGLCFCIFILLVEMTVANCWNKQ